MDGLIKGLVDAALGGEERDNEPEEPQYGDVRSRSTWAQVVSSGEPGDDEATGDSTLARQENRNRWNREGQSHGHDAECGASNWSPSRHPQKAMEEEYKEIDPVGWCPGDKNQWSSKEEGEKNDGWKTVGKKAPRHPKKVHKDNWGRYKRPLSEQEYSDDVECGSIIKPSEEELSDLSEACNKLWQLDLNRLVSGKDYQIDCGEGKKVYQKGDMAPGSLFSWLSEDIFRKPTFSRFCSLLDNYNPCEGYREVVTSQEKQEEAAFIEEISRTAPIKYVHKYLSCKGVVSDNYHDFKIMMTNLWFDLYGRGGTSGSSSAFEHVFVGEIKQCGGEEVSGFHNWLQFYLEEAKGRVDYQGYIYPRRRGQIPDSETQLLTIQFEWNGVLKSVSTTLIGVSPEFEVALYTLCFFVGKEDNHVQLGPYAVNIKCYHLGNKIGSAFPISEG